MKSHKVFFPVLCLLFLLAGICRSNAQQPQESLLIGNGDMLHIIVLDSPELEQHVRVTDAGEIPLLIGGSVKVLGMTPEEAAAVVSKKLVDGNYLVNPHIAITVEQFAAENISVLGEVKTPGVYPVTAGKTVAEALALAGGLLPDADRNIVIQRHGSGEMVTYYSSNSPTITPDSVASGVRPAKAEALRTRDALVYPGDTIRVARAEMVFALGDLGRPGGFPVVNNDAQLTVLQLVSLAGGANKTASLGHARLVRKGPDGKLQEIKLPLGAMQEGKKPDQILQANDIIYVPFSFAKNAYLGVDALAAAAASAGVFAF